MNEHDLEIVLSSICSGEKQPKFIKNYSSEISAYLESCGLILFEGAGVWLEIIPTEKGREFLKDGGFTEYKRKKELADYDRNLDEEYKMVSIINSRKALFISKIAIIVSALALLFQLLQWTM